MSSNDEQLAALVRQRTENFFEVHGLCCSESIMHVINQGLNGGLPGDFAVRLGSGFCGGMGGGDGTCGALTGAVAILGLFLSHHQKGGLSKKKMRLAARALHDQFLERYDSIRCKDLTAAFANDRKARTKNCRAITGSAAELAARLIIKHKPQAVEQADLDFLSRQDKKFLAFLVPYS